MFQSKIRTITPWYVFYPSVTLAHFKLSLSTLVHNCWIPGFDHSGITRLRSMEDPWKLTVGTYTAIYSYFVKYFSLEKTAVIRIYWFDMIYSFCCVVLHLLWRNSCHGSEPSSKMGFLRGISLAFFFLKKTEEKPAVKGSKYTGRNVKVSLWPWHEDVFLKKSYRHTFYLDLANQRSDPARCRAEFRGCFCQWRIVRWLTCDHMCRTR